MPVKLRISPRNAFEELVRANLFTHHGALRGEWQDQRHQYDQAGIGHQICNLADPTNMLDPALHGETKIAIQAVTQVFAVKHICVPTKRREPLLDVICQCRLACTRQSGHPQHGGRLPLELRTHRLANVKSLPVKPCVAHGSQRHRWEN
jgi:hypothetical protein